MTAADSVRWLVTGADGLLGSELVAALAGRDVRACGRTALDITNREAVDTAVAGVDIVVNAAAFTAVDAAESDEATAFAVNATGAGHLAAAAAAHRARLIHVSTDYVFDGAASAPYSEDSAVSPINAYGRTKAEGERRVLAEGGPDALVVRTAWLYGGAGDFPHAVLKAARAGRPLRGAVDQFGQPTWARDLAARVVELGDRGAPGGIYHGTNSGATSRFDFMRAVLDLGGLAGTAVAPARAADFEMPAARPAYSVLGHDAWASTAIPAMRPWREALADAADAGHWAA